MTSNIFPNGNDVQLGEGVAHSGVTICLSKGLVGPIRIEKAGTACIL